MYKIIPKTIRLALSEEEKDALNKVAAIFEELNEIIKENGQCGLVGYNGGALEYKRFKMFKEDIENFANTDEIQLL